MDIIGHGHHITVHLVILTTPLIIGEVGTTITPIIRITHTILMAAVTVTYSTTATTARSTMATAT